MSLVPYSSRDDPKSSSRDGSPKRPSTTRTGAAVISYGTNTRQIATRRPSLVQTSVPPLHTECPTCRRPFGWESRPYEQRRYSSSYPTQVSDQRRLLDSSHFEQLETELRQRRDVKNAPGKAQLLPSGTWPTRRALTATESQAGTPRSNSRLNLATSVEDVDETEAVPGGQAEAPTGSSPGGIPADAMITGYLESNFDVLRELGRGGKGVVKLVEFRCGPMAMGKYAVKLVPVGNDIDWLMNVLREVQTVKHFKHRNLVQCLHVWLEEMQLNTFGPPIPHALILQPFCDGGTLQRFILGPVKPLRESKEQQKERMRRRSRGFADGQLPNFSDSKYPRRMHIDEIEDFLGDITAGVAYLHAHGYIHCDIKPSNCLLETDEYSPGRFRVLLSDFGETQAEDVPRKSSGSTGTISFCAPELLQRNDYDHKFGSFTKESDMFAVGLVLYFMCFGTLPFASANVEEVDEDLEDLRAEIMSWTGMGNAENSSRVPDQMYQRLVDLLAVDPARRPTAETVRDMARSRSSKRMQREVWEEWDEDRSATVKTSEDRRPLSPTKKGSFWSGGQRRSVRQSVSTTKDAVSNEDEDVATIHGKAVVVSDDDELYDHDMGVYRKNAELRPYGQPAVEDEQQPESAGRALTRYYSKSPELMSYEPFKQPDRRQKSQPGTAKSSPADDHDENLSAISDSESVVSVSGSPRRRSTTQALMTHGTTISEFGEKQRSVTLASSQEPHRNHLVPFTRPPAALWRGIYITAISFLLTFSFFPKLIPFHFKAYTIFNSCLPLASNPKLAYPLLTIAALDFGFMFPSSTLTRYRQHRHDLSQRSLLHQGGYIRYWSLSLALIIVHFIALWVARRWNGLCVSAVNSW